MGAKMAQNVFNIEKLAGEGGRVSENGVKEKI